ncbi:hypothetical protein AMK15_32660 [Streptomyces sp. MJM1172]|nr:hypothetical protein AMK15_32660 [Streptomyces sp. MJM1172]
MVHILRAFRRPGEGIGGPGQSAAAWATWAQGCMSWKRHGSVRITTAPPQTAGGHVQACCPGLGLKPCHWAACVFISCMGIVLSE